jgi:hypothetical protein
VKTIDITRPADRRLVATAAHRVIHNQAAFPGGLARQFGIDRPRAVELLQVLEFLRIVKAPEPGRQSWTVLIRAERANEYRDQILEVEA